mgnify:FL=1
MVITTKHVNESQLEEIAGLIQNEESMINLDKNDVKAILMGKEGILYQAVQDEGVDNSTFMKDFFNELKKKAEVRTCTSILISIGMSQDSPLMMEDMEVINDFFESFDKESLEAKWGIKNNDEGMRMTLLIVCTKEST